MSTAIYKSIKYKIDKPMAILFLLISLPFVIIFAVIVGFELKAFPFIIQERGLSFDNCRLKIYKFRTIKKHSNKFFGDIRNVFDKQYLKEYVPPFCRWLRKTGFDELPQLINVIKGEMSLIGPRPLTLVDLGIIEIEDNLSYDKLDKISIKPGITGFWQVYGSRSQGIINMIWLQEYYEENISFLLDMKIFFSTLPLIFLGKHTDTIIDNKLAIKNSLLGNSISQSSFML